MRRSLVRLVVVALVAVVSAAALGACSSDDTSDRSTDSEVSIDPPTTAPVESIVPPTSTDAGATTDTNDAGDTDADDSQTSSTTGANLEVVSFELPAQVPCVDGTATAIADYTTTGAETVAFLVDQASVAGGPNPPVSGRHPLDLTCGATHTVVLVAVGGGGQVLASRAVTVDPPGGAPQG